jgi:hypothetical protein
LTTPSTLSTLIANRLSAWEASLNIKLSKLTLRDLETRLKLSARAQLILELTREVKLKLMIHLHEALTRFALTFLSLHLRLE